MKRRQFMGGCAALTAFSLLPAKAGEFDPIRAGVAELRTALDSGRLSSEALLTAYLQRIERLDPKIGSIIEVNPEALDAARRWDSSRRPAGPLAGIPVLLKDNIATADRMVTSAGSAALAESRYPVDSGVARRLRSAGAILLGKANMSEWANFRSDNATSGWSARGGQCRNPHVLDRSPCGSSSGSAAAVAALLAPLAVGTETVGSIVCPSGTCGIVGLKPTAGLVPGDGIIPIATSWDAAGPMARSVADVAALFEVLSGEQLDPRAGTLRGARLGVARDYFGFDWRVDRLMEQELERLSRLGATIVDPVDVPTWTELGEAAGTVMLYEFKAGLNAYLAQQAPEVAVRSLADVIAFNRAHPELEALDYLGQAVLVEAEGKGGLEEREYRKALAEARRLSALEELFRSHRLDAILGPTNGPAWKIDLVNGDHFEGGSSTVAAVGGYPHVTVPAGTIHRLPVGLSFFGPRNSEARLLGLAREYEQASRAYREPDFLPTLPARRE